MKNIGENEYNRLTSIGGEGSPWSLDLERDSVGHAAVTDDTLVVQTDDLVLHTLSAGDGSRGWTRKCPVEIRRAVSFGDLLILKLDDGWHALHLETGEDVPTLQGVRGFPTGVFENRLFFRRYDWKGTIVVDLGDFSVAEQEATRIPFAIVDGNFLKLDATGDWYVGTATADSDSDFHIGSKHELGMRPWFCRDGIVLCDKQQIRSYDWSGQKLAKVELPEEFSRGAFCASIARLADVAVLLPYSPVPGASPEYGALGFGLLTGELHWSIKPGEYEFGGLGSSEDWFWAFKGRYGADSELSRFSRSSGQVESAINTVAADVVPTHSGLIGFAERSVENLGGP